MKIGILSQNKEKNITGLNRSTKGVLTELLQIDQENEYYFLGKTDWMGIDLPYIPIVPATDEAVALNYLLSEHSLDIVHSYYRPFHIASKIPCAKILKISDLVSLVYPELVPSGAYAYFNHAVRKCAKEADVVLTVSESTKKDIIHFFGIQEDKIHVIYDGLFSDALLKEEETECVSLLEKEKFLLTVSGIGGYKNQQSVVESFLIYKQRHPDNEYKLAITGPVRSYDMVRNILNKYKNVSENVIFTGFVSDRQLIWLYRHATAFIYASFYEGFGLPILEAMAAGRAVISSNTSSMPEVGGDAAAYCNPHDVESIVCAVEQVLEDEAYRKLLEKKAIEQAKKFSFKKAAERTLEIYKMFE